MLEVLLAIGGHVAVSGYAYRRRYIRLYRNWRKWQAEDPNDICRWGDSFTRQTQPRTKVDLWRYTWDFQNHTPPFLMALLWPIYWPAKVVKFLLRPEVKVPDLSKIDNLEKELKELDR